MFIDPHAFESIISRPAAVAMGAHLFAIKTSGDTMTLATAGGPAHGVTVNDVDTVGRAASIFTEGAVPVLVGASGVTAGHDVMVGAGGTAVDATPGNVSVGRAEETAASGAEARITFYEPAQQTYGAGAGVGAEKVAIKALTGAAIHAAVQAWQNPESVPILITRLILVSTVVATGAGTLSAGTTAASATTASQNLIDTLDLNAAIGTFDNTVNHGTLGKAAQPLAAGKWVTFKEQSGDLTGFVGTAYIYYILTA